jgi:hypothetical protein
MPDIPKGAKKPADHKAPEIQDDRFTFERDGKTYTSQPIGEILTPGFVRRNRRNGEIDVTFTLIETLFADEAGAMDAIDEMSWAEFNALGEALTDEMQKKVGANTGE